MQKRIVLWGNDANDDKILVAIELIDQDNAVKIYTYDEKAATEEIYQHLMEKWRVNASDDMPEGFQVQERPLSVTDDLLPEDIKVERTDVIARAKAEWHFIVLSSKLYQMYSSELEDFKEKVGELNEYSDEMWEDMRGFWTKVQEQVREKNLFREHATVLRERTNEIFEQLKEMRKTFQNQFKKESAQRAAQLKEELTAIEEKIEKGLGLKPIFGQLKDLQARFKNERYTKEDQRKLWNRIDKAFKTVKEKRFGEGSQGAGGALSRVEKRYEGLLKAIEKMERSIGRDKNDLEWENKRIERTDGQLEMQIRQAKIKMIEERMNSKGEKLADMMKTKVELERKIEQEKAREVKRAEAAKSKEVQKEIKEKIAADIKANQAAMDTADAEKLKEMASKISEAKTKAKPTDEAPEAKEESLLETATEQIEESLTQVGDTVKAVADVAQEKIKQSYDEMKEKVAESDVINEVKENVGGLLGGAIAGLKDIVDSVEDAIENIVEGKEEEE